MQGFLFLVLRRRHGRHMELSPYCLSEAKSGVKEQPERQI